MADAQELPQIDWSTAEARRGTVTVSLVGAPPRGWRAHFKAVIDVLQPRARAWGKVRARKRGVIAVDDVRPGCEQDLRALLEGAVLQANSDLQAQGAPTGRLHAAAAAAPEDPQAAADRSITRTLQGFAGDAPGGAAT
jgi:hypothetical protein